MNRVKFMVLVASLALIAAFTFGCDMHGNTNENSNRTAANKNESARANRGNKNVPRDISKEDYEKDKESYEKQAKDLGRKIGTGANDLWLWTKTRSALAYADDLDDVTINVDVENDVVTLSGTVPNDSQKSRAEQVAKSVEGVKNVVNNINVSA